MELPHLNITAIQEYFKSQPVLKVWLFGSYARGEETTDSDVDLLVQFDGSISLLDHAGMMIDLEEILQKQVDLVREGSLYQRIVPYVEADKILIYPFLCGCKKY